MRQTVANILQEVAEDYGLTIAALKGQNRSRHITKPRQEAYYRAFVECPHVSYPEIARRIGGRDHTTIYWGVKQHCKRIGVPYDHAQKLRHAPSAQVESFIRTATAYGQVMEACRAY
jgi:chromosomal replication initiation ATPase DnaA